MKAKERQTDWKNEQCKQFLLAKDGSPSRAFLLCQEAKLRGFSSFLRLVSSYSECADVFRRGPFALCKAAFTEETCRGAERAVLLALEPGRCEGRCRERCRGEAGRDQDVIKLMEAGVSPATTCSGQWWRREPAWSHQWPSRGQVHRGCACHPPLPWVPPGKWMIAKGQTNHEKINKFKKPVSDLSAAFKG